MCVFVRIEILLFMDYGVCRVYHVHYMSPIVWNGVLHIDMYAMYRQHGRSQIAIYKQQDSQQDKQQDSQQDRSHFSRENQ